MTDEKPLRLIQVISNYPPEVTAGLEKHVHRMSLAMGEAGHQVIVLTLAKGNKAVERQGNVTIYRVLKPMEMGPLWGITYMGQVSVWLKRLSEFWDFAICHKVYLHSVSTSRICRKLGKPWANLGACAGEYGDLEVLRKHKGGNLLVKAALSGPANFIMSRFMAKEFQEFGFDPEDLWLFPNFVETEKYHPGGKKPEDHFLYIGRYVHQKNIPGLVEAFSIAKTEVEDLRLKMFGSGDKEYWLVLETKNHEGLEVNGWTQSPHQEYQKAYAMVTATFSEGLSNVWLESLASGCPVITPDVSGARDVLDPEGELPEEFPEEGFLEGKGGILVRPEDSEALARAMIYLKRHPEIREKMSKQGVETIQTRFTKDAAVKDLETKVRQIISGEKFSEAERGIFWAKGVAG